MTVHRVPMMAFTFNISNPNKIHIFETLMAKERSCVFSFVPTCSFQYQACPISLLGTVHKLCKQRYWVGGLNIMIMFAYIVGGWVQANAYISKTCMKSKRYQILFQVYLTFLRFKPYIQRFFT